VLLVLAASALLIAVVGLLLPREHVAPRSAVVPAPPDAVFALVAARVEVSGRERVTFEIVERRSPDRLVTRIADPDLPFSGTWTFELAPEGPGTRVTITERGEIYNPVFRALARFAFGYTASMDACLSDLSGSASRLR
jgi:hypothetical protein